MTFYKLGNLCYQLLKGKKKSFFSGDGTDWGSKL